jgi:hypothetical protein
MHFCLFHLSALANLERGLDNEQNFHLTVNLLWNFGLSFPVAENVKALPPPPPSSAMHFAAEHYQTGFLVALWLG